MISREVGLRGGGGDLIHTSLADLSSLGLCYHSFSAMSVGLIVFCAMDDFPPCFSCICQVLNDHPPYIHPG